MTHQVWNVGRRLLLSLALAAALLTGLVAVGWAMGHRNIEHAIASNSQPQGWGP
jgi:hypothetical protein